MLPQLKAPFLLISSPQLEDPVFAESVILIAEYGQKGALGFMINRPKPVPLKQVVQLKDNSIPEYIPTWFGGPVGMNGGIVLADQSLAQMSPQDATLLHPDIALSSTDSAIVKLVDQCESMTTAIQHQRSLGQAPNFERLYPYRFLVGYAGWGPGQVEKEIRQGSWIESAIDWALMYHTPWDRMWSQALGLVGAPQQASYALAHQPFLN